MQCIQNANTKQIMKNHLYVGKIGFSKKGDFLQLTWQNCELNWQKCIEKDAFPVIRSSDSW